MTDDPLLVPTPLLDFDAPVIAALLDIRGWRHLAAPQAVAAIHAFVRDEIAFGYNATDALPASRVLAEGRGQCNTKAILLMALLRAAGVPCRLHGFAIDKGLQRGIVPEPVFALAPGRIIHSWVEARVDGGWRVLEGFIIDLPMLRALQAGFPDRSELCGYGIGTRRLQHPPIDAADADTYIQSTAIVADYGVFASPDVFFAGHGQRFGRVRGMVYRCLVRHWMNARVAAIRRGRIPPIPGDRRDAAQTGSG